MSGVRAVPDGQYTTTVYSSIKDGRYADAVQVLEFERQNFPRARAALSILGACRDSNRVLIVFRA